MQSRPNYQEEETNKEEPNFEIDNYNQKEFNREIDEFDEMEWRLRLKKIVCFIVLFVLVLLAVFGLFKLFGGGTTPASSNKKGDPTITPGHKQEPEWVTDEFGNKYQILGVYARKSTHYTQGLYLGDGVMVESGGLYGQSSIQYLEVDEDGKYINLKQKVDVPSQYFAEGCDILSVNNEKFIFQLTWRENKIFKYNMDLKLVEEFTKPNGLQEGWGMTHKPDSPCSMIISDSTSTLHTVDCKTMAVTSSQPIKKNGYYLSAMNELEYVEDYLLSNVYLSTNIEIIDLAKGEVVRTLDMTRLIKLANDERSRRGLNTLEYSECLNGIAYDWKNKFLWVTGKNWPLFFKIKLPDEYLFKK